MLRRTILVTALTMTLGATESRSVPKDWFLAGSSPQDYVAASDRTVFESGKASAALAFGILLQGVGKVWIDSATMELVASSTPTTAGSPSRNLPAPSSLGFEE